MSLSWRASHSLAQPFVVGDTRSRCTGAQARDLTHTKSRSRESGNDQEDTKAELCSVRGVFQFEAVAKYRPASRGQVRSSLLFSCVTTSKIDLCSTAQKEASSESFIKDTEMIGKVKVCDLQIVLRIDIEMEFEHQLPFKKLFISNCPL